MQIVVYSSQTSRQSSFDTWLWIPILSYVSRPNLFSRPRLNVVPVICLKSWILIRQFLYHFRKVYLLSKGFDLFNRGYNTEVVMIWRIWLYILIGSSSLYAGEYSKGKSDCYSISSAYEFILQITYWFMDNLFLKIFYDAWMEL